MEKRPIRIALILNRTLNGGVESLLYNYCSCISSDDVVFDFYVHNTCDIINEGTVAKLGGKLFLLPSIKSLSYVKKKKKLLVKGKYDVVQANINTLNFLPLKAAKEAGVKTRIAYSLSTSNPKEKIRHIIKTFLRLFSKKYATHYFACSDNCATWLFGKKILKDDNYYKIYNAVDIDMFAFDGEERAKLIKKYNLENRLVIGNIGRLEPQKNHSFLIDVFDCLHKSNSNSFLMIIGDGHLKSELTKKIDKLGLSGNAVILGSKEVGVKAACAKYYSLFDAFVLPSLYEGLPVVGIEAQLSSLPCFFSTNVTNEVAISNRSHFLSLKEKPKLWAEAIEAAALGARETIRLEKYDIRCQSARLLKIYRKIIMERN